MTRTHRDRRRTDTAGQLHLVGRKPQRVRSIAELAVSVASPPPDLAARRQRHREIGTALYIHGALGQRDCDRHHSPRHAGDSEAAGVVIIPAIAT
jgi:hypothetical protein